MTSTILSRYKRFAPSFAASQRTPHSHGRLATAETPADLSDVHMGRWHTPLDRALYRKWGYGSVDPARVSSALCTLA
jgi:hypothetical protein